MLLFASARATYLFLRGFNDRHDDDHDDDGDGGADDDAHLDGAVVSESAQRNAVQVEQNLPSCPSTCAAKAMT